MKACDGIGRWKCETGAGHLLNITLFFISKEEVSAHVDQQENRFSNAKTVPGTQSYHCFVPNPTEKTMVVRRLSGDEPSFETVLITAPNEGDPTAGYTPIGPGLPTTTTSISWKQCEIVRYVGCRYDRKQWVRHIRDISKESEDVHISFMHPHGPARSLAGKRGHLLCTTSMCPMSGRCSKHNKWATVLFG